MISQQSRKKRRRKRKKRNKHKTKLQTTITYCKYNSKYMNPISNSSNNNNDNNNTIKRSAYMTQNVGHYITATNNRNLNSIYQRLCLYLYSKSSISKKKLYGRNGIGNNRYSTVVGSCRSSTVCCCGFVLCCGETEIE